MSVARLVSRRALSSSLIPVAVGRDRIL